MNNLLPLLFTLFIAFKPNYGASNTTVPATTGSGSGTTQMYTSTTMVYSTLADLTENVTMPEDNCLFYWNEELVDSEQIYLTICGYKVTEDEVDVVMVRLTLELPQDRWVGFGFISNSDFNENEQMSNVYAIIIPIVDRDEIQERNMTTNNEIGDKLKSTITLVEDEMNAGYRTITVTRKLKIGLNDLLPDNGDDEDKYFDFSNIDNCDKEIKVIWAFGKNNNAQFSENAGHGYNNRGSIKCVIEEIKGELCDELSDDTIKSHIPSIINIFIISIIAILIN